MRHSDRGLIALSGANRTVPGSPEPPMRHGRVQR
jgi:hypothetical protein